MSVVHSSSILSFLLLCSSIISPKKSQAALHRSPARRVRAPDSLSAEDSNQANAIGQTQNI